MSSTMANSSSYSRRQTMSDDAPVSHPGDSPTRGRRRLSSFNVRQPGEALRKLRQSTRRGTRQGTLRRSTLEAMPEHGESFDFDATSPGIENVRFIDVVNMMLGKVGDNESDDEGDSIHLKASTGFKRPEPVSTAEIEGFDAWRTFDRSAARLEDSLQKFNEGVLELGTSAGIVTSAHDLRHRIREVSLLFAINTAHLFPHSDVASTFHYPKMRGIIRRSTEVSPHHHSGRPHSVDHRHSLSRPPSLQEIGEFAESLPTLDEQLAILARDTETFEQSLEHFEEFSNRLGSYTLQYLVSDLIYWGACLKAYSDDYKSSEVRSYIHDLSMELGERFQEAADTITEFKEHIPAVKFYQNHRISSLRNLATVATFFSAVTASVIQFSWQDNTTSLMVATNALWFSSLTFSLASAVSSSLAQMWRSAEYTSRTSSSWWMWIWIRQSPPMFLFISLANFLGGLGCFVVATQSPGTQAVTLATEGLSAICISVILGALTVRKWHYYLFKRRQRALAQAKPATGLLALALSWADKPGTTTIQFVGGVIPTYARHAALQGSHRFNRFARMFSCLLPSSFRSNSIYPGPPSTMAPTIELPEMELQDPPLHHRRTTSDLRSPHERPHLPSRAMTTTNTSFRAPGMTHNISGLSGFSSTKAPPPSPLRLPNYQAREDWRHIIRRVVDIQRRERREEHALITRLEKRVLGMRAQKTDYVPTHHRGLRHGAQNLQLSCHKSIAFFEQKYTLHQALQEKDSTKRLRHTFPVRQVLWSADGSHLLSRTSKGLHITAIATESGNQSHKTVWRFMSGFLVTIRDPTSWSLLSFEGRHSVSRFACMDVHGTVHQVHELEHLAIHDADALPGGQRVVIVATRRQSPSGHKPSRRAQQCHVLLETAKTESEIPLKRQITNVKISDSGKYAVISSEEDPPQLWKIGPDVYGRFRITQDIQYTIPTSLRLRFAERAHFLGGDKFVVCGDSDGKVRIWRRDKPIPIRTIHLLPRDIRADPESNSMPPILATNMDADEWMFLTMDERGVNVWRHKEKEQDQENDNGGNGNGDDGREGSMNSGEPSNVLQLDMRGRTLPRSDSPRSASDSEEGT